MRSGRGELPVVGFVCRIEGASLIRNGGGGGADGGDMTVRFAASCWDAETQVRRRDNLKGFADFCLKVKAGIWP